MIQLLQYFICLILHPLIDKLFLSRCKKAKAPQAQSVFKLPPSFQFPGKWDGAWHETMEQKLLWMKQSYLYLPHVGLS